RSEEACRGGVAVIRDFLAAFGRTEWYQVARGGCTRKEVTMRRLRPVSRAVLPAAALAALLVSAVPAAPQSPAPHQNLARELYQALIEINTGTATGDTAGGAGAMAARLRAAGFGGPDLAVISRAPRKGNLVARLRGTGARKPILLLAHLDVVEARR